MSARGTANAPAYGVRLARVRSGLPDAGIEALLVTHPPNLRYLTGFDGSAGALLLCADRGTLFVDGRYITAAQSAVSGAGPALKSIEVARIESQYERGIAEGVSREAGLARLGIEAAAMTVSRFARLGEAIAEACAAAGRSATTLVPLERAVEQARLVKDAFEIATLREAAQRLSGVASRILPSVAAGRTERDIALDVDAALRHAGFARPAFDTIVASGPNSALPHARPGERRLQPGDGVVLDFGGVYDGYCVDLTRTVQLEPRTRAFGDLVDAVRTAQRAAIAAVAPGVQASVIDLAARQVLESRGLGAAFVHGTGHGLGLEVHEEPRLSRPGTGRDEILQPGMVFTIEPGVYVPGLGGVRIEDDVLVREDGCEVLTEVPIEETGC